MFCPTCGKQCNDDAKFCPICGHAFTQAQPQPSANIPANASGYNAYGQNPVNPAPASGKKSTAVLVLGIIAMVFGSLFTCLCGCLGGTPGIVCGIVGLVMGLNEKKNNTTGVKDNKLQTGIILCIIGLVLSVIVTIINMIIGAGIAVANY